MNKFILSISILFQLSFGQNDTTNVWMLNRYDTGYLLGTFKINDSVYVKNLDSGNIVFKDVNVRVGMSPRGHYFRIYYENPGHSDLVKVFKHNGDFYYQYYSSLEELAGDYLTDAGAVVTTFLDLAEFYINNPIFGIYEKFIEVSGGGMGLVKRFSPDGEIMYVAPNYAGNILHRGDLDITAYNMLGEKFWTYNFDNFPEDIVFTDVQFKLSRSGKYLLVNTGTEPELDWHGHRKVVMLDKDGNYMWHIDSLNCKAIQYDETVDRLRFLGTWRSSKNNRDKIIDVKLSTGEILHRVKKPRKKH